MSSLGALLALRKDFLNLSDILKSRGIMYSDERARHLIAGGFPSESALAYAYDKKFIVLPGPARPMNLVNIYNNWPWSFRKTFFDDPPFNYFSTFDKFKNENKFALEDTVKPGWYMLAKDILPGSASKTLSEQFELLADEGYAPPDKYIPNTAELAWCLTMYAMARGTRLLHNIYVRTSSVHEDGNRILVGRFDRFGLRVTNYRKDDSRNVAGIVPIFRFN